MAGVYRRKSDRARGKAGKYTVWYFGEDGRRKSRAGTTDRAKSLELARHLEAEAKRVREGIVDTGDRSRRLAAARPVAAHVEDFRLGLAAKGDNPAHVRHTAGVVARLLDDAGVGSVAEIVPERIQSALGRLRARRSPRTCNHALAAVRTFARWLQENNRIKEVPRGLASIPKYTEEIGRVVVRRALSPAELDRLLAAAEAGEPVYVYGPTKSKLHKIPVTGPERAFLYRLAMATGFRANELRSLTPESFDLAGDDPSVSVKAAYSKRKRNDRQQIKRDLAEALRPFLEGKPPGAPVVVVPHKTAGMLRRDLGAAGIPHTDPAGAVVDFHALRHSYITGLVARGLSPKAVQKLARHSTITLTLDRYTHLDDGDVRGALEGGGEK